MNTTSLFNNLLQQDVLDSRMLFLSNETTSQISLSIHCWVTYCTRESRVLAPQARTQVDLCLAPLKFCSNLRGDIHGEFARSTWSIEYSTSACGTVRLLSGKRTGMEPACSEKGEIGNCWSTVPAELPSLRSPRWKMPTTWRAKRRRRGCRFRFSNCCFHGFCSVALLFLRLCFSKSDPLC